MNGMVNDEELLVVAFDIQLRYGFESAWECLMLIVFFWSVVMKTRKEATLIFKQITRTVYWRHPLPLSNWHGDQAKLSHKQYL